MLPAIHESATSESGIALDFFASSAARAVRVDSLNSIELSALYKKWIKINNARVRTIS